MSDLPTLDAHCHLAGEYSSNQLAGSGYALAMTLSLAEAGKALHRSDPHIAWGVGCYPRSLKAQTAFDVAAFRELAIKTAIIGEVGLDSVSPVSLEKQLQTFRAILEVVSDLPRLVSIHSYRATGPVLEELQRTPISTPVLHWWTGSAEQTSKAVELGCYFSIHSAVARHSKYRTRVPPDRILVESDHGYPDPPEAIPCRIEWAEHLVAQQLKTNLMDVRRLVWRNFARIMQVNGTAGLLPEPFSKMLAGVFKDL
jgi:TatD DNase family protein